MWKNTMTARLLNSITNSAESLPREFNNAIKMKCGLQKDAFVFWIVLSYLLVRPGDNSQLFHKR